jgi:hypothetical protein
MKNTLTPIVLALTLALAACGKAKEAASEKIAEKMIESSISKDGTKAKVDLSAGGAKVTTTDANGKTSQFEMGTAKITETEAGVPFYPGAALDGNGGTRMTSPEGTNLMVALTSTDPADKVSAFYRDKLKPMAEGRQFIDMDSSDGNHVFSLIDDKAKSSLQVQVQKAETGSHIQIVSSRGTVK